MNRTETLKEMRRQLTDLSTAQADLRENVRQQNILLQHLKTPVSSDRTPISAFSFPHLWPEKVKPVTPKPKVRIEKARRLRKANKRNIVLRPAKVFRDGVKHEFYTAQSTGAPELCETPELYLTCKTLAERNPGNCVFSERIEMELFDSDDEESTLPVQRHILRVRPKFHDEPGFHIPLDDDLVRKDFEQVDDLYNLE